MRKKVSAYRRLQRGRASNYISHDGIKPGDQVVLACRVSTHEQNRIQKLIRQIANLTACVRQRGGIVVGVIKYAGSGWDPFWVGKAAEKAREYKAKIVFETTNRAIRHPGYHSKKNFNAQARTTDLEELRWWTQGIELVTILNPDATASEERSIATRRGQVESGNKGGRPLKRKKSPNASNETLMQARAMRRNGASHQEIANHFLVKRSTAQGWTKGVEKGCTKTVTERTTES